MSFLNLKTAAVAVIVMAAVIVLVPGATRYAGYAVLAVCPLMMLFMMGGHGHGMGRTSATDSKEYICPMHPEVRSTFAATCPRCGMKLVPTEGSKEGREGVTTEVQSRGEWGHEH